MRLPRKFKKEVIKVFGRGTYKGIIEGVLKIAKYHKNRGCETLYTGLPYEQWCRFYDAHQYNPYITNKNTHYL